MDNEILDNIIFVVLLLSLLFLWFLASHKKKLDYVCRLGFQIKNLKHEVATLKCESQDLRDAVRKAMEEQKELSEMKKRKKSEYIKSVIDF